MEITRIEARLIHKVLNEGMPSYQPQRDVLARLSNRIEDFIKNGFEATPPTVKQSKKC